MPLAVTYKFPFVVFGVTGSQQWRQMVMRASISFPQQHFMPPAAQRAGRGKGRILWL